MNQKTKSESEPLQQPQNCNKSIICVPRVKRYYSPWHDDTPQNYTTTKEGDFEKMLKLSELQHRIDLLWKISLETVSLYEIKGHPNLILRNKKQQATLMQIADMLNDMKKLDIDFYNSYCSENPRTIEIISRFESVKDWTAFNGK